jgi:hypothetical protein
MPTANFEVMIDLPDINCPEDTVKEMCRTLKPTSALVDGSSLTIDPTGRIVNGPGAATWHKYTKTAAELWQASPTFDIELFLLPAGAVIQAIKLKHSEAFTGGALSAYTLSIGIGANLAKYMGPKSVYGAPTSSGLHVVWAPFFNAMLPASLPIGASYSQSEITAFRNAFQALFAGAIGAEDHLVATSIRLAAAATGGNTSLATSGSVDVWVLYSTLT